MRGLRRTEISKFIAVVMGVVVCTIAAAAYGDEEGIPAMPANAQLKTTPMVTAATAMENRSTQLEMRSTNLGGATTSLATQLSQLANDTSGIKIDETDTELKISLSGDVLFDFDKATIRADAEASLAKIVEILSNSKPSRIRIVGYTDSKGSDPYNQKLSEKRAASVATWFKTHGLKNGWAYESSGRGSRDPVEPNKLPSGKDNPEGRQKNRRVEISVKKVP